MADPESPPSRVSDSDRRLAARVEARASDLQAQALACQTAAAELRALASAHLHEAYGLDDGDTVEDDGTITRKEPGAS